MKTYLLFISLMLISCSGPKGDKGDTGTPGLTAQNGVDGKDGKDAGRIVSSLNCRKTANGITHDYSVNRIDSGDTFVSCGISDSSSEYYNAEFYKSGQNGNSLASCLLTYDIDSATSGFWTYSVVGSSGGMASFTDIGGALNGLTIFFGDSDCVTN